MISLPGTVAYCLPMCNTWEWASSHRQVWCHGMWMPEPVRQSPNLDPLSSHFQAPSKVLYLWFPCLWKQSIVVYPKECCHACRTPAQCPLHRSASLTIFSLLFCIYSRLVKARGSEWCMCVCVGGFPFNVNSRRQPCDFCMHLWLSRHHAGLGLSEWIQSSSQAVWSQKPSEDCFTNVSAAHTPSHHCWWCYQKQVVNMNQGDNWEV